MNLEPTHSTSNGYVNGFEPAPPLASSGAGSSARGAPRRTQPTIFPPENHEMSLRHLLYHLGWAQMAGTVLLRWLWLAALALALLVVISPLPGKWYVAAALPLALLLLVAARRIYVQRDFLTFRPLPDDAVEQPPAQNVVPADKIPVHVSGWLDVSGKSRRFVWLPGFYRTFATREHVLICQVRDRSILRVGRPPEADVGLWYAFFAGAQIRAITRGMARMGRTEHPALAILYTPDRTQRKKKSSASSNTETLYITGDVGALQRIHADLLVEAPAAPVLADA